MVKHIWNTKVFPKKIQKEELHMKKLNIIGIGIVLIALITISIFTINSTDGQETITIGSILILSGGGSAWGEAAQNGIDFAVADINANGGVLGKELVIQYEDDQGSAANTVTAFQQLTQVQGIDFIIGPSWSKQGLAIKDLIDNEVVISPSLGSREFNENNEYAFNARQHDYILSRNLAKKVYEEGHKTVAILSVNDPYNKEQADEFISSFEKLGGNVAYVFDPMMTQTDVRSDLLKVKDRNDIDALVATTGGTVLTTAFAVQVKELGLTQPVYSLTIDQTVISNSRGGADGWVYLSAFTPTEEFANRYEKTHGSKVHIGSDSAYDAVIMLAQAMKETGTTNPEVIKDYLNTLETFSGVSGDLTADGEGGFTKNFIVNKVVNGTPVLME
jgi:branched-chain amino acid transport system substrate-binding protein